MKIIDQHINKLLDYSKYYLGVSLITFSFLGEQGVGSYKMKVYAVLSVLISCYLIYKFMTQLAKKLSSTKLLDALTLTFSLLALALIILGLVDESQRIANLLWFNIPLNLALRSAESKKYML